VRQFLECNQLRVMQVFLVLSTSLPFHLLYIHQTYVGQHTMRNGIDLFV